MCGFDKNGNDIMVMDKDEAKVRDLIYDVTKVQIGDCTDPQVVKALGINNFDLILYASAPISRAHLR